MTPVPLLSLPGSLSSFEAKIERLLSSLLKKDLFRGENNASNSSVEQLWLGPSLAETRGGYLSHCERG